MFVRIFLIQVLRCGFARNLFVVLVDAISIAFNITTEFLVDKNCLVAVCTIRIDTWFKPCSDDVDKFRKMRVIYFFNEKFVFRNQIHNTFFVSLSPEEG